MNKTLFGTLIIFTFSACISTKGLINNTSITPSQLLKKANENKAEIYWFTSQLKGKAKINDKNYPISAQLCMRQDSIIWISVSGVLGIEAARIQLTPDTIKLINRLSSSFFVDDFKKLTTRYNIPFSFYDIQGFLLGKHPFSNPNLFKILTLENDYLLFASSDTASNTLRLNSEHLPIEINSIQHDSISFKLNYSNFIHNQEKWLPQKTKLQVLTPNKEFFLAYSYFKILINKPKKTNFSIPSSYAPM